MRGARCIARRDGFVGGFSVVFMSLGVVRRPLTRYWSPINKSLVILLVRQSFCWALIGGVVRLPFLQREARFTSGLTGGSGLLTAFVMGLAFAFGWTPCIGPILATILALAATRDSLGDGVLLLGIYAAGLGLPFILAALGIGRFLEASKSVKQHMLWVERGAGACWSLPVF